MKLPQWECISYFINFEYSRTSHLFTVKEAPLAIAGLWKDEKQLKGIRAKEPFLTREL
jgi:hypothetical protein